MFKALEGLVTAAGTAADAIGNLTVALSKIDISTVGGGIVKTISEIPSTVAGLPGTIYQGAQDIISNGIGGINKANSQNAKYNYALTSGETLVKSDDNSYSFFNLNLGLVYIR